MAARGGEQLVAAPQPRTMTRALLGKGVPLTFVAGRHLRQWRARARDSGASHVYWNRLYEPGLRRAR